MFTALKQQRSIFFLSADSWVYETKYLSACFSFHDVRWPIDLENVSSGLKLSFQLSSIEDKLFADILY